MAKQVQYRRGTTTEHTTFTGALGEISVDTTKKTVVVHDGSTAGGFPLARGSDITSANVRVTNLESNAAVQALVLSTLTSNAATQSIQISSLQSSINAANILIANASTNVFERVITPEIEGVANVMAIYSSWAKDTGISIVSLNSLESVTLTSDRIVAVSTNFGASQKDWIFEASGGLRFPDNSIQSTAWLGNVMSESFTMANATHWTSSVTTIGNALNQLAARLYAIENP